MSRLQPGVETDVTNLDAARDAAALPGMVPAQRLEELLKSVHPDATRLPPGWLAYARLVELEATTRLQLELQNERELHKHWRAKATPTPIPDHAHLPETRLLELMQSVQHQVTHLSDIDILYANAVTEDLAKYWRGRTFIIRPELPPLDDTMRDILGRPNFACIDLANGLRARGRTIKPKAEHEQAEVLHFLLGMYLQHGVEWEEKAQAYWNATAPGKAPT